MGNARFAPRGVARRPPATAVSSHSRPRFTRHQVICLAHGPDGERKLSAFLRVFALEQSIDLLFERAFEFEDNGVILGSLRKRLGRQLGRQGIAAGMPGGPADGVGFERHEAARLWSEQRGWHWGRIRSEGGGSQGEGEHP